VITRLTSDPSTWETSDPQGYLHPPQAILLYKPNALCIALARVAGLTAYRPTMYDDASYKTPPSAKQFL